MKEEIKANCTIFGIALLLAILTGFGVYKFLPDDFGYHHGSAPASSTIFQPFDQEELIHYSKVDNKYRGESRLSAAQVPTVLVPGMGDSCFNPGFSQLTSLVAGRTKRDAYCYGPGSDAFTDPVYSFTKTMDEQVEHFAKRVQANTQLASGFNAMGLSQGNLVIRAYIQRYNNPPVLNFISVHGPHAGVASVPRCDPGRNSVLRELCDLLDYLLGDFVYTPAIQSAVAQSNYFRDPFKIPTYLKGCSFLPDVLENASEEYRKRFVQLKHIALIYAERDSMIYPKETAIFGSFAPRSYNKIVPAQEQEWYKTIGLEELQNLGRVTVMSTPGDHMRFSVDDLYNWVDLFFM